MNTPDIAFINGAGWKPFNEGCNKDPGCTPHRVPELLWPLGDGSTVLSRIVQQLRAAGINEIVAGVGEPGSDPVAQEENHLQAWGIRLEHWGEPVWTEKRIRYIKRLGVRPVLTVDPHRRNATCWDTMQAILEQETSWTRAIVLAGDYILSTPFFNKMIAEAKYPSQIWVWPKHDVEFLDRVGAEALVDFLHELGTTHQGAVYLSRGLLARRGFKMVDMPAPREPKLRQSAFRNLRKGWFEVGTTSQKMFDFAKSHPVPEGVVCGQ